MIMNAKRRISATLRLYANLILAAVSSMACNLLYAAEHWDALYGITHFSHDRRELQKGLSVKVSPNMPLRLKVTLEK
jgi:hypothetical protein